MSSGLMCDFKVLYIVYCLIAITLASFTDLSGFRCSREEKPGTYMYIEFLRLFVVVVVSACFQVWERG